MWFDLVGARQFLPDAGFDDRDARSRSAAFPFELAYRLTQMHSLIGDTVLDPFLGTGTTVAAAIASGRSSIGYEIERELQQSIRTTIDAAKPIGIERVKQRLSSHLEFVRAREELGKPCRHRNTCYGCSVMTGQETDLQFVVPRIVEVPLSGVYSATHELAPLPEWKSQREFSFTESQ